MLSSISPFAKSLKIAVVLITGREMLCAIIQIISAINNKPAIPTIIDLLKVAFSLAIMTSTGTANPNDQGVGELPI